ncbi:hypothetical protein EJ04DRAFT_527477 [Polyplosphaeria fusca]|uniref:Uncharacterized protein n=1 Tax=Polyplosphaeria fusca TaxID=682080 RepID=A0A9P4QP08_9PLEO|nr:hypothetical protein EJ04DRAFT_527477 [Polyplosphaeria fusca]
MDGSPATKYSKEQLEEMDGARLSALMRQAKLPSSGITRKEQKIAALLEGRVTPEIKAMKNEKRNPKRHKVTTPVSLRFLRGPLRPSPSNPAPAPSLPAANPIPGPSFVDRPPDDFAPEGFPYPLMASAPPELLSAAPMPPEPPDEAYLRGQVLEFLQQHAANGGQPAPAPEPEASNDPAQVQVAADYDAAMEDYFNSHPIDPNDPLFYMGIAHPWMG